MKTMIKIMHILYKYKRSTNGRKQTKIVVSIAGIEGNESSRQEWHLKPMTPTTKISIFFIFLFFNEVNMTTKISNFSRHLTYSLKNITLQGLGRGMVPGLKMQ